MCDLPTETFTIQYVHDEIFTINGLAGNNAVELIENLMCKLGRYQSIFNHVPTLEPRRRIEIKKSYIYLMYDTKRYYYKIGRSINPKFREKTLQAEAPSIETLFVSPLTYALNEQKLHKHFDAKRVRGEWFFLDGGDVEFIKNFDFSMKENCE